MKASSEPLYSYDETVKQTGCQLLAGVDEAGRGPLAGPVYAAAVILPGEPRIEGLNDSKKLSPKRREALFEQIVEHAVSFCIAEASREEIDAFNIQEATFLAMRRAAAGLETRPDLVLVDGNLDPGLGLATETVVGGDGVSASIAAASILAKVARDRYMLELDERYPAYNFAKHKGYGTKLHYEKLDEHGACPEHRTTFLRKWEASRAR